MNNDRFKGLPWVEEMQKTTISVFGLGGIGSYMSFFLCRAGATVIGYDYDIIENANLSGQLYRLRDVNIEKGKALTSILQDYTDDKLRFTYKNARVSDTNAFDLVSNFTIVCFDNILARKQCYEAWVEKHKDNPYKFFIDIRLAVDYYEIFFITSQSDKYEKHLYDDSEVIETPCTLKQTTHIATMSAAHAQNLVCNYLLNIAMRDNVMSLPFRISFNGPDNHLTYED